MPRVVEGLMKALIAAAVTAIIAYVFLVAIFNIIYVTDKIDSASIDLTGLPAKTTKVSSGAESIARQASILAVVVPVGIMVVYFIHRPKR